MKERYFYNDNKSIILTVDNEGTQAYLKLSENCLFTDEKEIDSLITNAGIKYGFENAKKHQKQNNLRKELGKPFLIAQQTPPKIPDYKYNFSINHNNLLPSDYKHESNFANIVNRVIVNSGTELATLTITNEGEAGTDIFGSTIHPPSTESELGNILCGSGVDFHDNQFISNQSGFPLIDSDGKLSICSLLTLETDIVIDNNYYTTPCSLYIEGNICGPGYLEVEGNLAVTGKISNVKIFCSGKTLVKGQVTKTILIADKTIGISEATDSKIIAGNNLKIEGQVEKCLLVAENSVIGNNQDNNCRDCSIYASQSISVGSFILTQKRKEELAICYSPYYRELLSYWHNTSLNGKTINVNIPKIDEKLLLAEQNFMDNFSKQNKDQDSENNPIRDYSDNSILINGKLSSGAMVRIYHYFLKIDEDTERIVFNIIDNSINFSRTVY